MCPFDQGFPVLAQLTLGPDGLSWGAGLHVWGGRQHSWPLTGCPQHRHPLSCDKQNASRPRHLSQGPEWPLADSHCWGEMNPGAGGV